MSVPVTVKVDLGIGELIEKLDEINERRKGRKEEFFSNICDDLESVHTIVYALDNLFVDLPQRYSDRTLVDSSEMWRKWHGREQALEADSLPSARARPRRRAGISTPRWSIPEKPWT